MIWGTICRGKLDKCLLLLVCLLVLNIKLGPKEEGASSLFFRIIMNFSFSLLHCFSVSMNCSTYFVFQFVGHLWPVGACSQVGIHVLLQSVASSFLWSQRAWCSQLILFLFHPWPRIVHFPKSPIQAPSWPLMLCSLCVSLGYTPGKQAGRTEERAKRGQWRGRGETHEGHTMWWEFYSDYIMG